MEGDASSPRTDGPSDGSTKIHPVAVVGAGPHALMIVLRLMAEDHVDDTSTEADRVRSSVWRARLASRAPPSDSSKCKFQPIAVFDPSGEWNAAWKQLFSALEIPHLRSPCFVGPDPFDSAGCLRAFVARSGWPTDRHFVPPAALPTSSRRRVPSSSPPVGGVLGSSRRNFPVDAVSRDTFALPSTRAFNSLCGALTERLSEVHIMPLSVKRITACWGDGPRTDAPPSHFTLHLSDGTVQCAANVIVAKGSQGRPKVPSWVVEAAAAEAQAAAPVGGADSDDAAWRALHAFGPSLWHVSQLASGTGEFSGSAPVESSDAYTPAPGVLRARFRDKRVLVVGGGITSVHLTMVALAAGCAQVILLTRRPHLTERQFDVDVAWLTRARSALLYNYRSRTIEDRASHAVATRGGGSIPQELFRRLRAALEEHPDRAQLWEGDEVVSAAFTRTPADHSGAPWNLRTRGGRCVDADVIVLATGTTVDITTDALFTDLMRDCARPGDAFVRGIPALDASLRWSPGINVFLSGAYASNILGPDASNLAGGLAAARVLREALRPTIVQDPTDSCTRCSERPQSRRVAESIGRVLGGDGNLFAALGSDSETDNDSDN